MHNHLDEKSVAVLKEHGLKVTPQRKEVLTYLMTHTTHPTVEMVAKSIDKTDNSVGLATVYNTLNTFVELGIAIELQNGDGSKHYDYFQHPHFHVICTNCGNIEDLEIDNYHEIQQELLDAAKEKTGYLTSETRLEIYGLCPKCQKKLRVNVKN